MSTNKGFTLIELLVVIAIIGILASVVLSSLNSARAGARDAKRTGDIRAVITALEMYRNQFGQYPTYDQRVRVQQCGDSGWCLYTVMNNYLVPNGFLGSVVSDPTRANTGSNYRYCGDSNTYAIIRYKEATNAWCLPPGQPSINTGCGGAPPNSWYLKPAC